MTWRRSDATRNALIGAAVVLGLTVLALPLTPSLRRYMRMKRV